MPTEISRPAVSVEFLQATVTSNVPIGTQVVRMAVITADQEPVAGDFAAVSWVSATLATTNTARKSAVAYTAGTYDVYVQIEGSPEIPVLYAGRMTVT